MKHGEIWWAELEPPAGRRPVLLLSRDEAYAIRKLIIVVPVTSKIRHLMTEVILGTGEGLPRPCVINLDIINTISKSRLIERITTLSPEKLRAVEAALHFALGLES
jgi:mRNA interferase MazF